MITLEQPPPSFTIEQREYLARMFRNIDNVLRRNPVLQPSEKIGTNDKPGMLMWFTSPIPSEGITQAGLWFRDKTNWKLIT